VTLREMVRERRDAAVLGALQASGGNRRRAAATLDLSLRQLLNILQQMRMRGIDVPSRQKVAA
jgi:DNA-binding NtrC family response regulator